jgi:hypothetical protein
MVGLGSAMFRSILSSSRSGDSASADSSSSSRAGASEETAS